MSRALALHQQGKTAEAAEGYRRVLRAAPEHAEANHLLGLVMMSQGRYDEAATLIGRAIETSPRNAIYRSNLGVVFKDSEKLEEAKASYEAALEIDPDLAEAHSNLGVVLLALKEAEAAVEEQRKALALKPDYAEAHTNLGRALFELRQRDEAIASYREAIRLRPDYANAHLFLGQALEAEGEHEEAEEVLSRAVALRPMNPAMHHALGSARMRLRDFEGAAVSFQRAVQLKPDPTAYRNLGNVYSDLGRPLEAARAYMAALATNPDDPFTLGLLGGAQFGVGQTDEAMETFQKVIELDPKNAAAELNLGVGYLTQGRLEDAHEHFGRSLEIDPNYIDARSGMLFLSNYLGDGNVKEMTQAARDWGARVEALVPQRTDHANDPDPERKLRIGVVSGDLRSHPVGFFTVRAFEMLDPEKVELYMYASAPGEDELTERFKAVSSGWHEAFLMGDKQLEEAILEDKIDILIDLVGHTARNRLRMFARKPAPVSFTWLGYFATTGLTSIDYVLCNRWVIPPEEEDQWVEKPWRLPETYLCFSPPRANVPVAPLPAVGNGYITFGSANNLNKLSDQTARVWSNVIKAVPNSKLLLRAGALRDVETQKFTRERFRALGLSDEQLLLEGPASPYAAHLARYHAVDIALDCFPYAGGTTTVEALWMGVPVVTLKGDRYVSHMGESILNNIGMPEWIGADEEDYVRRAAAFAGDIGALAAVRGGLRDRMTASPLIDAERFARRLEEAFRSMWRIWCAGRQDRESAA